MTYYQKNIMALKEFIGDVKERIETLEKVQYGKQEVYETEQQVIMAQRDGASYALTSRKPENECQLYTKGLKLSNDNMLLVFGIANRTLLKYLVEQSSEHSKLIVFEADMKILKYCLEHYDYTFLTKGAKCILILAEELDEMAKKELRVIQYLGYENLVYNMHVLMQPNYYDKREYVHEAVRYIKEILIGKIQTYGNSMEDNFKGVRNNYKNIREYVRCNKLSEMKDQYKGYPGIIVSAGPSLEKNIQHLKKAYGKALIIACDASVKACEAQGVEPDAVASIERVPATYQFYYKDRTFDKDLVLIGPSLLWPDIFKEFPGKKIILSKLDHGMDKVISNDFERLEYADIGMSSANVAFRAAVEAGCNPIILIGQDLAFTDGKIHSDSTHTAFEGKNDDCLFDGNYVEGIYGGKVKTNDVYNLFRNWFELQCTLLKDRQVIDATEGGARIKGTAVMTFENAVNTYCTKETGKKLTDCLEDVQVTLEEEVEQDRRFLKSVQREIETLRKIQDRAANYYKKLEDIFDKNIETMSRKQLVDAVQQMQEGNEIIAEVSREHNVYMYFQQIVKQTISHVKALGNDLTNENVLANLKLQGNLMGMIKNSCDVIIDEYTQMKEYIEHLVEDLERGTTK